MNNELERAQLVRVMEREVRSRTGADKRVAIMKYSGRGKLPSFPRSLFIRARDCLDYCGGCEVSSYALQLRAWSFSHIFSLRPSELVFAPVCNVPPVTVLRPASLVLHHSQHPTA
ncbi:hypothetical protein N7495_000225 [Penicillium taxi]|uniref:uncharacterized protein n=1 Tax=Penicillium taxi TaxID=168475 RepID=UPI0025454E4E|nr:uncharacterized protein N7495_000225 [Penicillium taxi]KAJ5907543.1 hypothetical protein N7495_000225 [Penicillium taxi]